jgi:hypothetical protein
VQKGIDKLTGILQNNESASFTAEEYMSQYTTIYNMCTQRAPHEYSEQLYNRYKKAFVDYLHDKVRDASLLDTCRYLPDPARACLCAPFALKRPSRLLKLTMQP